MTLNQAFNEYDFMTYKKHLINTGTSIQQALTKMDKLGRDAILFVINDNNKMLGSVTDGDIRRGLIKGVLIDQPVDIIAQGNPRSVKKGEFDFQKIINYRNELLRIIPVLDNEGRIVNVINLAELRSFLPIDAVIMAGGKGLRLRPLTEHTPKPLLPVVGKPIIEHNIDRLISYGVNNFFISINYLGEQIENYFGNGNERGVHIKYLTEEKPLGTIGAVSQIDNFQHDIVLVTNSDILTNIDYEDFFIDFKKNDADFSVVSIPYHVNIPYAVLETNDNRVIDFKEKPTFTYYSNGGIYLIKRSILNKIPSDTLFNTTDLMELLIAEKAKVISYTLHGYWLDIGNPEDYKKAQAEFEHIKF